MPKPKWHSRLVSAVRPSLESPLSLTSQDLTTLLLSIEEVAGVPHTATLQRRIAVLIDHGMLEAVELRPVSVPGAKRSYPTKIRYITPGTSVYTVASSFHRSGYFSHGTAAVFHGVAPSTTTMIVVNREQSAKPARGFLTQEALDRAFTRPARTSAYVYAYRNYQIHLLNGKHTESLGVVHARGPDTAAYSVTGLERMLIDIAVRPQYAGGLRQVLAIYSAARERINATTLLETLTALRYVYPYHQAIGFLMSRAGYPADSTAALASLGCNYDFHLQHGTVDRRFSTTWRISYPSELDIIVTDKHTQEPHR